MSAPVIGSHLWFICFYVGYAAWFEAMWPGILDKPWLAWSTDGSTGSLGHTGELSKVHCQSLATRWRDISGLTCSGILHHGRRDRKELRCFGLVYIGRNARPWLIRIVFDVSPLSDRIGLRFIYLHEKSLFCIEDPSRSQAVDQLHRLLR
jgi:hypothetical protein